MTVGFVPAEIYFAEDAQETVISNVHLAQVDWTKFINYRNFIKPICMS